MKSATALLIAILAHTAVLAQTWEGRELVRASLVADTAAVVAGKPFTVGLRLEMEPGWHTYWQYSGDAGLPTRIDWKLPPGFKAGPIQWPTPHRMVEPGDIVTYGYGDEVLLLTTIVPPDELDAGTVEMRADARWLVCEKICIPGAANDLALTLPVGDAAESVNGELFTKYRAQIPSDGAPFAVRWSKTTDAWKLQMDGVKGGEETRFFPIPAEDASIGHPVVTETEGGISVSVPFEDAGSAPLSGVLASGDKSWEIPASETESSAAVLPPASPMTLWSAVLFGFIGGLILNLMPCVLPVIALKIFGFMNQAGQEPRRARTLGFAFVAGIFAWFLGLAALIAGLRFAGRDLNWAFQFQNPIFVLAMAILLFVFAMNLLGVFEIYLPGHANTRLTEIASREGHGGAFLHGLLATLLATPCMAPFLGAALGFAFVQPPAVIFTVFGAIAFGMSLPYVLLSLHPEWTRLLPKPGAWMETVKEAMGFLLLATVLFLLWVYGRQRGVEGMAVAGAWLLVAGLGCWMIGRFFRPGSSWHARFASVLALAMAAAGVSALQSPEPRGGGIEWKPFSRTALEEARESGRVVFIDFTADWCVNCKWNERFVLATREVEAVFAESDVIAFKADWTNGDPEITGMLRSFDRVGVPVYVVYPPGPDSSPKVLPELLTKENVTTALREARE